MDLLDLHRDLLMDLLQGSSHGFLDLLEDLLMDLPPDLLQEYSARLSHFSRTSDRTNCLASLFNL